MYRQFYKRLLDIILATIGLILVTPLMLLTALAIFLETGPPVFFIHERVGRHGVLFRLAKFRSMPVNTENVPSAIGVMLQVTKVGRFIRRTNIDELPQLFNILQGDMSIVGPRPALPIQENLLAIRINNGAAACRPGLTGLAQINSYDGMPEEEKAKLDGKYTSDISFIGDLIIILRTFSYLLHKPPVY